MKAQRKNATALQSTSSLVEIAQVANEGGFIGGVASTMIGMTLLVSAARRAPPGTWLYGSPVPGA